MSTGNRAALPSDAWENRVAQIPSVFGRLVYLSSLRDQATGLYTHEALAQELGQGQAHHVLLESHVDAFVEWLCFTLEQQKKDLELYLASLDGDLRQNLAGWPECLPYHEVIPEETEPPERMLYLTDVEIVLHLLKTGY